jgi:carbonic anhydrase
MAMNQLIPINKVSDILPQYRDTPVGLLLEYHNLNRPWDVFLDAKLLIGMCMDHRKRLRIPENFAYIIRTGGANLRQNEFQIAYALSVGEVKGIALIAHTQCGMVNLNARRDQFVQGLAEVAAWEKEKAEEYFFQCAPFFEIRNEVAFVISEAKRLRFRFPHIIIVPLLYRVEDHRLYQIEENLNLEK